MEFRGVGHESPSVLTAQEQGQCRIDDRLRTKTEKMQDNDLCCARRRAKDGGVSHQSKKTCDGAGRNSHNGRLTVGVDHSVRVVEGAMVASSKCLPTCSFGWRKIQQPRRL